MNQTPFTPEEEQFAEGFSDILKTIIEGAIHSAQQQGNLRLVAIYTAVMVSALDNALGAMLNMNLTIAQMAEVFKTRAALALKTQQALNQAKGATKQ